MNWSKNCFYVVLSIWIRLEDKNINIILLNLIFVGKFVCMHMLYMCKCVWLYLCTFYLSLSLCLNLPFPVKEILQYDSILNLEILCFLDISIRITRTYVQEDSMKFFFNSKKRKRGGEDNLNIYEEWVG